MAYRKIVERRVRTAWRHLAGGDYEYVLDQFSPTFEYSFAGDHALGGTRHSREAMTGWFERLFELFPEIRFEVADVLVKGWPWRTRAVVLVDVRTDVAGEPYRNEVAQTIELRWGRITRIRTLEDTQKLDRALQRLAAVGVPEAELAAIED
jgi:ketosteroid isomerase-like protein